MAVGELIGGAIGILLLVIVAYVLVGATLSTAEIVSSAQQDITQNHITRLHTDITVTDITNTQAGLYWTVRFNITNTGSETISSLKTMDVFISANTTSSTAPTWYYFGDGSYPTWNVTGHSPDYIHPGQLDPGETIYAIAQYPYSDALERPNWIEVVTGNGAYDSAYI